MQFGRRFVHCVLMALFLFAFALQGCQIVVVSNDPVAKKPEEKPAEEKPSPDKPKPDILPEPEKKPEAKDPDFDEAVDREKLREERRRLLVQQNIEMAKSLKDLGDFEGAYAKAAAALDYEPDNDEALRLFNNLGALLGRTIPRTKDDYNNWVDVYKAKLEHAQIEIKTRKDQGMTAFENKDYKVALDKFRSALDLAKVMPAEANLNETIAQLEKLVEYTNEKYQRFVRDEEMQRKAAALALEEERTKQVQHDMELRVNRLWQQARQHFEEQNFEQCEKVCNQILRIVPGHAKVKDLRRAAIDLDQKMQLRIINRTQLEHHLKTFADVEEITIPYAKVLTFPDDEVWELIEERAKRFVTPEDDEELESEAIKAIRGKLKKHALRRLNFTPDDTYEDLFEILSREAEVNFILHPDLAPKIVFPSGGVSFDWRTIFEIMNLVTELLDEGEKIRFEFKDEGVYVLPVSGEDDDPNLKLKTYDVDDLTYKLYDYPGPPPSGEPEDPQEIPGTLTVEDIQGVIETFIFEGDNSTADLRGNTLVIRTSPEKHKEIDKLLSKLRAQSGVLVSVETRLLKVAENYLRDIGVDFNQLNPDPTLEMTNFLLGTGGSDREGLSGPGGSGAALPGVHFQTENNKVDLLSRLENLLDNSFGTGGSFALPFNLNNSGGAALAFNYIDDIQLSILLRGVEKTSEGTSVTAPRVTMMNYQRSHVAVLQESAYVSGSTPTVGGGVGGLVTPEINTLRTGMVLDVRPIVSSDQKHITLELRPWFTELQGNRTIGSGDSSFDVPELGLITVATTVRVPDGGIMMLSGFKQAVDQEFTSTAPILGSIPVLKFLFERKSRSKGRAVLVLLVKATVINASDEELSR